VSFAFGMNDPREIESYGAGMNVTNVRKGSVGSIITAEINGS
jgi:hypothetical protein